MMKDKTRRRKKAKTNGCLTKTEAKRIERKMKKLTAEKYGLDQYMAHLWAAPLTS